MPRALPSSLLVSAIAAADPARSAGTAATAVSATRLNEMPYPAISEHRGRDVPAHPAGGRDGQQQEQTGGHEEVARDERRPLADARDQHRRHDARDGEQQGPGEGEQRGAQDGDPQYGLEVDPER